MKRPSFRSCLIAVASTLVACGGISDPTKSTGGTEKIATVSGALTGTNVPAGARVALVWRVGETNELAVTNDVAIVAGKFTMDLTAPPSNYFFLAASESSGVAKSSSGETTEEVPPSAGSSSGSSGDDFGSTSSSSGGSSSGGSPGQSFAFAQRLHPRTGVSGSITDDMSAAVAGFVVYVDTNGNGKLDLAGPTAKSTDEVIGGNRELMLTYLQNGGALDYEKLRDKAGVAPTQGFNLMWNEQERWLQLSMVELKLNAETRLPGGVCVSMSANTLVDPTTDLPRGGGSTSSSSGATPDPDYTDAGPGTSSSSGYPSPDDPNLKCSEDGHTFSWSEPVECEPEVIEEGLCASDARKPTACSGGAGGGGGFPYGEEPPPGWPCPVAGDVDGGAAQDAGAPSDAGQ